MPSEQGQADGDQHSTRRAFVKTTATAAVGAAGVASLSGQAAAGGLAQTDGPDDYPRVSTRDHFDSEANLVNGNNEWNYETGGDWWKYYNWGEDLVLFVHGFLNSDNEGVLLPQALNAAFECNEALRENGYDQFTAAYSWDADKGRSLDVGWADAKDIARRQGRKLANFITNWNNDQWVPVSGGGNVHLVAHSLGARVVGETLTSLREDFGAWKAIGNVTLLGAAIDDQEPCWGYPYARDVDFAAERVDNYWSDRDGVLDYIYEPREFDGALGHNGSEFDTPGNFTDRNVSGSVGTHFDYYQRGRGCMDRVAWNL